MLMKPTNHNQRSAKPGFTLVEIVVVLAIAAVLTAVTVGGYSSMRASNRRTSCQANMAQIYQAIRLYAADNSGNVPYYDPSGALGNGNGIGLWALYTFASDGSSNTPADSGIKPEKRYLNTAKLFHCPNDQQNGDDLMYTGTTNSIYNSTFLSYQTSDTGCANPSDTTCSAADGKYAAAQFTYNPIRLTAIGTDWQRQLLHYDSGTFYDRPPTDDTVILWCPFHRGGGAASTDNVLFWDGTVQMLPENQGSVSSPIIGAERTPKAP